MSFLEIAEATFRGMDPQAGQKLQEFQNWTKQTGTRLEEAARNIAPESANDEGWQRVINAVNPESKTSRESRAELD
jgi:hypothetical protein